MTGRLLRCPHCGQRHDSIIAICPTTGRPVPAGEKDGARAPNVITQTAPGQSKKPTGSNVPYSADRSFGGVKDKRDLIGTTIGKKYVVREILGEGGMGTVYEAEHLAIGRAVAVKVLHPQQMRKKEAVKRFQHEARAAGAIGHPNICEVYDLGTLDDGRPYLVMEKLVGNTLADRIREHGGLPVAEVADVLTQVLSGLVVAHAKGILHRDIKPENVFLASRVGCPPVAKLLDFGVSKIVSLNPGGDPDDEMVDLTRTGMVMGTPYYMSPEQARGDRNLDGRVDLYACGVLAYEAVTGRRPFVANNYHALLLQILDAKLRSPRELRRDLPPTFERIILKAMARKRDDRYPSAADFQYDLQRLRMPEPPLVRTPEFLAGKPTVPILDVSSDAFDSSSTDIPIAVALHARTPGFDDQSTDVNLRDFSLEEDDAATTLMRHDEIRELALRGRTPGAPVPVATPEPFDAEETMRMTRDPARQRAPVPPRRAPKTR